MHGWTRVVLGFVVVINTAVQLIVAVIRDFSWLQPSSFCGAQGSFMQI